MAWRPVSVSKYSRRRRYFHVPDGCDSRSSQRHVFSLVPACYPMNKSPTFLPSRRWDMYLTLSLSVTLLVGPGNVLVKLAPVSRSSVTCANHVRNVGHENVIAYTQPKRDRGRAPLIHQLASRVPTHVSWDPS